MMKLARNMPIAMIMFETFYPIAPLKAKQSVAKVLASYDWLMVSNHPISCLSKFFRYSFLHAILCLYPAIIQQANMAQPITRAPRPM